MSLRFASIEAMEFALGKKLRVKDSFHKNETPSGARWRTKHRPESRPEPQSKTRPRNAKAKAATTGRRSPGPSPHDLLWNAASMVLDGLVREFENAVPGRKYRLDIALLDARLAIEVDGWEWHGKHKGDFTRDRERQNLLTLHGWRILRFTAGQIRKDTAKCVEMIKMAVASETG